MSEAPPGVIGRGLMRAADRASLATNGADGWPYASLVLLAVDQDASPLLLLSDLAEHSKNLKRDPRVALLVDGTGGLDEPLTGPRVTVLGRAERSQDARHKVRFVAHHPGAAGYADFKDFAVYRVAVERGHLVAGFGRIHWIEATDLLDSGAPDALAEAEPGIIAHMNADHGDAIDLYVQKLLGGSGQGWRMTGIDPEGCDFRLGGKVARLDFPARIKDAAGVRAALVELARRAREP
ncbi:MAG: HugZ family protein [Candidatus Eiseniibacteriota bacterium]